MTKIDHIWQDLDKEVMQKKGSGVIRKLVSPETPLYISLGICSDTLKHLISFEINEGNLRNYMSLPRIKGIEVNNIHFGDEQECAVSLVLSVSSSIYNHSFDILCQDLVDHVLDSSENELISKLADRLGVWKRFFSENPCNVMTEEKQIGLSGELNLILRLLDNGVSESLVINSWKGYNDTSQDFVFCRSMCIEVKASKSHKNVKISSEHQLDESEYERCFMYFCNIGFSDEATCSLNQLVDNIRGYLANKQNISRIFEDGLLQYGYFDIHRDYYTRQFHFKNTPFFEIKTGFPRIKNTDLRAGVNSVRYMIDLTNLDEYEVLDTDIIKIIDCEAENG